MTTEELLKAIKSPEWTGIEFKQCRNGVSEDAYKTVSAFANTNGGHLVFGIKESTSKAERETVGVEDVDKVQNDFLSCLRNGSKLSRVIPSEAVLHEIEGKHVLEFYIPEADRKDKPIYMGRRIDKAYIRRGGGDELCTESEIRTFIRDASDSSFDSSLKYGLDAITFINSSTLKWYRNQMDNRLAGRYSHLSEVEFLLEMGLMMEEEGKAIPTMAAILLFGKDRYIRQILPRPVLDYQRIDSPEDDWDADNRWHDRIVIETNLFEAWRVLFDKYSLIADVPFSLDETTLQRKDDSLEYRSFREAAVNLLIHQDYGDAYRKAEIKIFKDKTVFWNPGAAYSSVEALLESRHHSIRNPLIVRIFRQIGLCEEAGTGIRTIMEDCRKLGLFPAKITNDKAEFSFSIAILKIQIISQAFENLLNRLDIHLNTEEAAIFSYLVTYRDLNLPIAKAITGKPSIYTLAIMLKLESLKLAKSIAHNQAWSLCESIEQQINKPGSDQATDQATGQVSGHVTGQVSGQVSGKAHQKTGTLTDIQVGIILRSIEPISMQDLRKELKLGSRYNLRTMHIHPLLERGILMMSFPESPKHPKQKYYLSDFGKTLLKELKGER